MLMKDIVNLRQIFSEDTIDDFFNDTIKKGEYWLKQNSINLSNYFKIKFFKKF